MSAISIKEVFGQDYYPYSNSYTTKVMSIAWIIGIIGLCIGVGGLVESISLKHGVSIFLCTGFPLITIFAFYLLVNPKIYNCVYHDLGVSVSDHNNQWKKEVEIIRTSLKASGGFDSEAFASGPTMDYSTVRKPINTIQIQLLDAQRGKYDVMIDQFCNQIIDLIDQCSRLNRPIWMSHTIVAIRERGGPFNQSVSVSFYKNLQDYSITF